MIEYFLDPLEKETVDLMNYYEWLRRNKTWSSYFSYSRSKDPRESKAFKYFKKIVKDSKNKNFSAKDYIKSQFDYKDICPPHFLISKESFDKYKRSKNFELIESNYSNIKKEIDKNFVHILSSLEKTKEFLEKFCNNNYGSKKIDYKKVFKKDSKIWFLILNGFVSYYFLSISKSYKEIYDFLDMELKNKLPKNLDIYKKEIEDNLLIKEVCLDLFKDEIWIS